MMKRFLQAAVLLGLAVLVTLWTQPQGTAHHIHGRDLYVIDGDTLAWGDERVRLRGIDAPEIRSPECAEELRQGQAARAALEGMVRDGRELVIYETGERDRYHRLLGRLSVDGRDAGEVLMAKGLATPYRGRRLSEWCKETR